MTARYLKPASALLREGAWFARNLCSRLPGGGVSYVTDGANWSIRQDGLALTDALNSQRLVRARVTPTHRGLRNQIVHFGYVGRFMSATSWARVHESNSSILTWFHVTPGDARLGMVSAVQAYLEFIHTSCSATAKALAEAGVPREKIVVIPLGVDCRLFRVAVPGESESLRRGLGIPPGRLVIGSFQKDGIGWGDGLEPKSIKGPDVLVQVLNEVRDLKPFVLLVGPARGYVKRGLSKCGIEHVHVQFERFQSVARMYRALDLYLITSRVEGGPKAILEAWASGVALVSTRVGMVPDLASHQVNAMLADSEDVASLAASVRVVAQDRCRREQMLRAGWRSAQELTWHRAAMRYYDEMYATVLDRQTK